MGGGKASLDLELRPIVDDEWVSFVRAGELPFHSVPRDADFEIFRIHFPLERSIAVFDGDDIVGTAGAFDLQLTVPGGGQVATAGVTAVAVLPTHRRRGVLTSIMRRQFADYHEGGVPLAALWASESLIYGRFGYGLASWCLMLEIPKARGAFVPTALEPAGRLRLADPQAEESRAAIARVDELTGAGRPGWFRRDAEWLRRTVADPEHWREGSGPLQLVLHEGAAGVDGYALYSVKTSWAAGVPDGQVTVRAADATDPAAFATLWRYLLDIDLVGSTAARLLPVDSPLLALLADPRAARPTVHDSLFVRLVDVPVALAARSYARPVDVVLDVRDDHCPWNGRRWRLAGDESGATCEPTSDPADLTVSVTALGAAYLGGRALRTMVAAGQVAEQRQGALAATSAAMHGEVAPHCPEVF